KPKASAATARSCPASASRGRSSSVVAKGSESGASRARRASAGRGVDMSPLTYPAAGLSTTLATGRPRSGALGPLAGLAQHRVDLDLLAGEQADQAALVHHGGHGD